MNDLGAERLKLTVYGEPKGAGSKTAEVVCRGSKGSRTPLLDQHGNFILRYRHATLGTEEWMVAVAREASVAWAGLPPLDAALWLDLICFETRPDGHFYADGRLKPNAPAYPHQTTTHDSGKLRRAIEDACTKDPKNKWAPVLVNDKRIVDGHDRKRYCDHGDEPRAVIRIGLMAAQTVEQAGVPSPPPPGQAALV
jgi:hypothetical protein